MTPDVMMRPTAPPRDGRLIEADPALIRRDFNRASFAVRHNLSSHPLFDTARLVKLTETLLRRGDKDKCVVHGARANTTGTKFTDMPRRQAAADSVRCLDETGSWMKLSHAHEADPEYRELMDQLVLEIEELSQQPLREVITWPMLTVFLASPHIVTPYHIDHESNFLLQVAGKKEVYLFDGFDRSVLSSLEIERFYSGNAEAARYREDLADRATVYQLAPGTGVHHPPLAPHWVRNGDTVSVSVSVSFCLRPFDREARIHQANLVLRRLGLRPAPLGQRISGDRLKVAAMQFVSMRRPTTRGELLFSGIRRLAMPVAAVRRLRGGRQ